MKLSGSQLLVNLLESNGVEYVFGVPGGHLLKFYNSLVDSSKITPILTKHEAGASFMATGFAQVSEKIGVCVGTVGPGATNLITGVASAYMDSIPLLVLTAQVGISTIGKGGLQEATGEGRTINHVEIFDGMTKYSTLVFDVGKLDQAFRKALTQAINGRPGPTHLDITANTFGAEVDVNSTVFNPVKKYSMSGDPESISKAAELIFSSRNPAILTGYGSLSARQEILNLAETYSIPVATTLRAKGLIPENHKLSLGVVGLYGTNIANKYIRSEVDVLLAIGLSFSEFTTHSWDLKFQPSTALIQIDIDVGEIGKNYPVEVGIIGDSRKIMEQLLTLMKKKGEKTISDTNSITSMKKKRLYYSDPKMVSEQVPLKPQRVMKDLREALPEDVIVFGDIGNNLAWVESFFQARKPKSFFICSTLASMGYGVAASIGGQIAAPERQVVCICGDGDFQMQGMEVLTALNYDVPVKWFILNNGTLGMIRDTQDILFNKRRISTDFINPDYVKLAEAMGAEGLRIKKPSEIAKVVKEALGNERPTIIDVIIDSNEAPSFDARAEAMINAWGIKPSIFQKMKLIPSALKRR